MLLPFFLINFFKRLFASIISSPAVSYLSPPLINIIFFSITTLSPPCNPPYLTYCTTVLLYSIPNCQIIETGWDKGNWTVLLEKTEDMRLTPGLTQMGPESCTPVLHVRK